MVDLKEENVKLKMELITVIMGYEKELLKYEREEMSEFSKGCMERMFQISNELKEME